MHVEIIEKTTFKLISHGRESTSICCRKLSSVWYVVCELFVVNHVNVENCTVFFYYLYIKIDYILSHFYHQLHQSYFINILAIYAMYHGKKYEAKKIKVIYRYWSLSF